MTNKAIWKRNFEINPEDYTSRQSQFVKKIESGPRGRVTINYRMWLHNMDLAEVAEPFGLYLTQNSSVTKRQKEILILTHAKYWESTFEWNIHVPQAKKLGITDEQIQAIADGKVPTLNDEKEKLTYDLAIALHFEKHISDDLYDKCLKVLGHKGVSDIIGLIGLYTMAAHSLCFYQVPIDHSPPWAKLPFKLSSEDKYLMKK